VRQLRFLLIGVLVLVALLPVVPAVLTARALLRTTLDPLLEETLLGGATAGLEATRARLASEKRHFEEEASDARRPGLFDTVRTATLAQLDTKDQATLAALSAPPLGVATRAPRGALSTEPTRIQLAGRELLAARLRTESDEPVWITRPIPEDLVAEVQALTESHRMLQTFRHERGSVLRSLVVTFAAVYGAILVSVLLLGLLLASRLTSPLAALGQGIERVSAGDLAVAVRAPGTGPIAHLVAGFNGMVAELRQQRAELARLERLAAWRRMARHLAHEIKNPLTPIQLAAQQLRDAYRGTDPAYAELLAQGTTIIEEEVESLRSLTVRFSEFARMPEPELTEVALGDIATGLAELFGSDRVVIENRDRGSPLLCDRDQMRRALMNLVSNALDAQKERGATDPVLVELFATGEHAVVRVLDRGPGVRPEDRERIFEPDVTTKPNGMGLGLAIVESTARAHGGTIAVEERGGGGAVFTLSVPLRGPRKERFSAT